MKHLFIFTHILLFSLLNGFAQMPSVCNDTNSDGICDFSEFIHIDQFGYLPSAEKVAVISNPQTGFNAGTNFNPGSIFEIRDFCTDSILFSGSPAIWNSGNEHPESGDKGWWFDFSSLVVPGEYFVYDPTNQVRSSNFLINPNVYRKVLKSAVKMFYYNRCNFTKSTPYAGTKWTDGMNFNNALQDYHCRYYTDLNNTSLERDLSGGWFDAGDYNKYVTFATPVIHDLLWAYRENPTVFSDDWNIPESGNSIPDLLDEVKYELEWLLKMTNPNGSVHIKMGTIGHANNISSPPSTNIDQRVYGPTCSSASIGNAGVFAHAAEVFSTIPGMSVFADTLEANAERCWNFALPMLNSNTLEENCDDGTISAGDADLTADEQKSNAILSAIHLYSLTGTSSYNNYVGTNINDAPQVSTDYWDGYLTSLNSALLEFVTLSGANTTAVAAINSSLSGITGNWNGYMGFDSDDLYRAEMQGYSYHWGSNKPKAGAGILNLLTEKYNLNSGNNASYLKKAAELVHYFHGVNPFGMVQLSNMYELGGDRCANEIYHLWFYDGTIYDHALNSSNGPAPGFVVGGPNKDFTVSSISPPSGQPYQKSYLDFNTGYPDNSWEISEPSITYQSRYIRLLANYADEHFVRISPKAFLEGAFSTGSMSDQLRIQNLIPSNDPYVPLGYTCLSQDTVVNTVFSVSGNDAVIDWVFIELRDRNDNSKVLYSQSALIQSDGDIVDLDGVSPVQIPAPAGDYYIAVRHRNHLSVLSQNTFRLSSSTTSVDFSSIPTYGTNAQKNMGNGINAMWTGDINASGIIDFTDQGNVWTNRNMIDYSVNDVNLDGKTDAEDRELIWNNRGLIQQLP